MVKTLKITGFLTITSVVSFVVLLFGISARGDSEIDKLLTASGVVDKFRANTKESVKRDQISPLVKQARLFALKIDPPPPPKPKPAKRVAAAPTKEPGPKKAQPPAPRVEIAAKFKLLGTCRYPDFPEKSLANLEDPVQGGKWYRQGEQIGHLSIHEIKNGSIILHRNGEFNSELFMPKERIATKSLLKSASIAAGEDSPQQVTTELSPESESAVVESLPEPVVVEPDTLFRIEPAPEETIGVEPAPEKKESPARPSRPRSGSRSRYRRRRNFYQAPEENESTTEPSKPPQPTRDARLQPAVAPLEERKKMLDENIANIEEMMAKPSEWGTDEEKTKELKTWTRLLEDLKRERSEAEQTPNAEKAKE